MEFAIKAVARGFEPLSNSLTGRRSTVELHHKKRSDARNAGPLMNLEIPQSELASKQAIQSLSIRPLTPGVSRRIAIATGRINLIA